MPRRQPTPITSKKTFSNLIAMLEQALEIARAKKRGVLKKRRTSARRG